MALIEEINQETVRMDRLKYACIVLIPKKEYAERILDYKPISLELYGKNLLKNIRLDTALWLQEFVGDYQMDFYKKKEYNGWGCNHIGSCTANRGTK